MNAREREELTTQLGLLEARLGDDVGVLASISMYVAALADDDLSLLDRLRGKNNFVVGRS